MSAESTVTLVRGEGLSVFFPIEKGLFGRVKKTLRALHQVSLSVMAGETLGLVGESGSGKSTLGRVLLRLLEASAGRVEWNGTEVTHLNSAELRPLRKNLQIIFQDPYSSLNPRLTVYATLVEPLRIHRLVKTKNEAKARVAELLNQVGLRAETMFRYPHEFSGGQRQRIGIARALACSPSFIVADEAVSALDVSVQAQVLNLLKDLQEKMGLSYLFIAHDLRVVQFMSQRVAVMYLGQIVELAPVAALYHDSRHPYTRALLEAIPIPDPARKRTRLVLAGELPNPVSPPTGCSFHPRCPLAKPGLCDVQPPEFAEIAPHHWVSCHLA